MAVVTEPPWVNQTSGIAPRNGTTSHTIPFGFTPASGNELVFVVFGAVTHAAGWTERLQPVSTAELSVFTKTAAGDTSITVAHNGSDYPVCFVAYELPAGSSWVGGTGTSPTSDTFPALSGLPGVEVVVFGARGRTPNATDVTSGSAVWSSPWVEDGDLFAAHNGATQGAYLTAGHQINVAGTSVTPSAAMTYSGGTWSTDRQHVVFAFNVASVGGTTHTATASGASTSTGSAAVTLTASATTSGTSTSVGSAAAGLLLRGTATGSSTTGGTAAAVIVTGAVTHTAAAAGASASDGTAAVALRLAAGAAGATTSAGSAAAVLLSGPQTYPAAATGAAVSDGTAAARLTMRVTAAAASTSGGTATPTGLLAALASAAATSAGSALAGIVGESVKATSTPTVAGGTSTPTLTAAVTSTPVLTARRTSTSEVTHG